MQPTAHRLDDDDRPGHLFSPTVMSLGSTTQCIVTGRTGGQLRTNVSMTTNAGRWQRCGDCGLTQAEAHERRDYPMLDGTRSRTGNDRVAARRPRRRKVPLSAPTSPADPSKPRRPAGAVGPDR